MRVVLTGGGTMGHVTPLIEIAKELELQGQEDYAFYYFGNEDYTEKNEAKKNEFIFTHIPSRGLENLKSVKNSSKIIFHNTNGIRVAYNELKKIKPDFILSAGGFVTAPVLLAAKMLKIPYFIHEQNKVLGKVNKLFYKKSKELYLSFEDTYGVTEKGITYGNPTKVVESCQSGEYISFLGGSGGSIFINELACAYVKQNPNDKVLIQAGVNHEEKVREELSGCLNVKVVGFAPIDEIMNETDLVVTRSGSSTLFELIQYEKPAIYIPLPNSADNHQFENAVSFEQKGYGVKIEQKSGIDKCLNFIAVIKENKSLIQSFKRSIIEDKRNDIAKNIAKDITHTLKKRMS